MCLEELSGCELIALASIIAIILSEGKTSEQIDLLGNFFSTIGQNLSTIALDNTECWLKC